MMTPDQFMARCRDDFEFFARKCLFVRAKDGKMVPFVFNTAQKHLHHVLEKQREEIGRVRAVIVKGRQMGASTYIEGRFYWRTCFGQGLRAFILTHEQAATDNLFKMARRYHEHCVEEVKRSTNAASAKELAFADNDCSYTVATAGTKEVGRSATVQLFHGSEVAFWPNAEDHVAGIIETIADVEGTERLFESTANGIGNVFQRRYSAAERGESDDLAIFMPWYWDDGYTAEPVDGWDPSRHWTDYQEAYQLDEGQLAWAYRKNRDMASATGESSEEPCWKFKQEYPANAQEAFQTAGNSFIPSPHVARARVEKKEVVGVGALILGVDPARGGGDKTGIIDRCGRVAGSRVMQLLDFDDIMMVTGHVVKLIKTLNPDAVNIDVGGLGAGVFDRLREMGYGKIAHAINFGSRPLDIGPTGDELYDNRRAEMWDVMRDWIGDEDRIGVIIPDSDMLHRDLTAPIWDKGATRYKSNGQLILEPKDKIKERLGNSPDLGDALALTFAIPVNNMAFQPEFDSERRAEKRSQITGY